MNEFQLRQATKDDISFLVDTIIEAEKSGTNVLTYTTIFGLTETEARNYIAKMLQEDVDGCELSVSGFILAEKEGNFAGAVGAWLEGSEGISSNILKGNLLRFILPPSCLQKAAELNNVVHDLHIDYTPGTIQIGLVYVTSAARGMGLVQLLINNRIDMLRKIYPHVSEAYIQVFGNNMPAMRAYEKSGFEIVLRKTASLKETGQYMPDICKVLMKKNI